MLSSSLLFSGQLSCCRSVSQHYSLRALDPAGGNGYITVAQAAEPTTGAMGAESLIASGVSGAVSSRIEKIAGISQLSIDPVLGGSQQDPGARITIQQRVTGNLFVTFATDATSTGREVIKLEYQATPRVGLSGVRDQNGGFAVDVRIKRTW